jgi:NAD-dependent deacetylase
MAPLPPPHLPGGILSAPTPTDLSELRRRVQAARGVVVLTGAGVSAESGVPTFRDAGGLWRRYRAEELATPEAFQRDPALVWEWYDLRRRTVATCEPNPAHESLARALLARDDLTLVTQNVDGLHRRAVEAAGGPWDHPGILELHGAIFRVRCTRCGREEPHVDPVDPGVGLPRCPACDGILRPAVVWFGEPLPQAILERAFQRAATAELCLVVGTSALVHPAASVPLATLRAGGELLEVNPESTPLTPHARWSLRGAAGRLLPALLDPDPLAPPIQAPPFHP